MAALGVAPSTASGHLSKLLDGGIVIVVQQGRRRYFRIAGSEAAASLEALMAATAHRIEAQPARPLAVGPRNLALRRARVCYDHLAGELGVALFEVMVARGEVRLAARGAELTAPGEQLLVALGIPLDGRGAGRSSCRPCLDWSERRDHLAGYAAAALCSAALERGWVARAPDSRTVRVTRTGATAFSSYFGIDQIAASVG